MHPSVTVSITVVDDVLLVLHAQPPAKEPDAAAASSPARWSVANFAPTAANVVFAAATGVILRELRPEEGYALRTEAPLESQKGRGCFTFAAAERLPLLWQLRCIQRQLSLESSEAVAGRDAPANLLFAVLYAHSRLSPEMRGTFAAELEQLRQQYPPTRLQVCVLGTPLLAEAEAARAEVLPLLEPGGGHRDPGEMLQHWLDEAGNSWQAKVPEQHAAQHEVVLTLPKSVLAEHGKPCLLEEDAGDGAPAPAQLARFPSCAVRAPHRGRWPPGASLSVQQGAGSETAVRITLRVDVRAQVVCVPLAHRRLVHGDGLAAVDLLLLHTATAAAVRRAVPVVHVRSARRCVNALMLATWHDNDGWRGLPVRTLGSLARNVEDFARSVGGAGNGVAEAASHVAATSKRVLRAKILDELEGVDVRAP